MRCRYGLTLPLGLLHAGISPRDSCHPSITLGCGLGHTFTSLYFSITFLGTFAIVQRRCRALHRWETADLDGEVPFPKRGAWLLGLQQVLLLLSSPQIPLFPPQLCLNPQGLPSPLHCCTRALSASHSSQAEPSDDLQDQLELVLPYAQSSLMKGPQCLHHYSAFPPVQRKFLFPCRSPIIGVGEEVGRSCTVSLPGEHQELQ